MMKTSCIVVVIAALAGCAPLNSLGLGKKTPTNAVETPADPSLGLIRPVARGAFSKKPASGLEAAMENGTKSGILGLTVASLGDVRQEGLWLKTPLVDGPQRGKISFGNRSANVQLLPLDAEETAGSRISLQAMQAIGAPLTGLPELTVTAF